MSPLFLSLGVLPEVSAATNQYIGMISTLSVTFQFIYKSQLNFAYTGFLSVFIFVSGLLGLTYVNKLVKYTGRQSVIVFILTFVLFSAFLLLPLKYALD